MERSNRLRVGISVFGFQCETYEELAHVFLRPDVKENDPNLYDVFLATFRKTRPSCKF